MTTCYRYVILIDVRRVGKCTRWQYSQTHWLGGCAWRKDERNSYKKLLSILSRRICRAECYFRCFITLHSSIIDDHGDDGSTNTGVFIDNIQILFHFDNFLDRKFTPSFKYYPKFAKSYILGPVYTPRLVQERKRVLLPSILRQSSHRLLSSPIVLEWTRSSLFARISRFGSITSNAHRYSRRLRRHHSSRTWLFFGRFVLSITITLIPKEYYSCLLASFDKFMWAKACASTRAFGATVDETERSESMMVPFVDMLNHRQSR